MSDLSIARTNGNGRSARRQPAPPVRAWRPSPEQEWLLTAAFASGEACLTAWRRFRDQYDPATANLGTTRLLPIAYENLRRVDPDLDPGPAIRDTLARMWCETQIVFDEAAMLLDQLRRSGIRTLVLKGVALAFLDYAEPTLRPLTDVDLLVARPDALRAMKVLSDLGWRSTYAHPESFMTWTHAVPFANDRGGRCDLHWQLLWNSRWGPDDDDWQQSVDFEVNGVAARAMDATDRLFHVCAHAMMWNEMSPVRWAADAATIIRTHGPQLEWHRLVADARSRRLALPIGEMLSYLRTSLGTDLPDDVLRGLRDSPSTRMDRLLHYARTGAPGRRYATIHLHDWWVNAWSASDRTTSRKAVDFWQYQAALYHLREWQVPFYAVYLAGRQTKNALGVLASAVVESGKWFAR